MYHFLTTDVCAHMQYYIHVNLSDKGISEPLPVMKEVKH